MKKSKVVPSRIEYEELKRDYRNYRALFADGIKYLNNHRNNMYEEHQELLINYLIEMEKFFHNRINILFKDYYDSFPLPIKEQKFLYNLVDKYKDVILKEKR